MSSGHLQNANYCNSCERVVFHLIICVTLYVTLMNFDVHFHLIRGESLCTLYIYIVVCAHTYVFNILSSLDE